MAFSLHVVARADLLIRSSTAALSQKSVGGSHLIVSNFHFLSLRRVLELLKKREAAPAA